MEPIITISVLLDTHGHALGGSISTDDGQNRISTRPLSVGPFDTAQDVFSMAMGLVDEQLSLF